MPTERHRFSDPLAVACPECSRPVHSPYGNGRTWHLECWGVSAENPAPAQTSLVERALARVRAA